MVAGEVSALDILNTPYFIFNKNAFLEFFFQDLVIGYGNCSN